MRNARACCANVPLVFRHREKMREVSSGTSGSFLPLLLQLDSSSLGWQYSTLQMLAEGQSNKYVCEDRDNG